MSKITLNSLLSSLPLTKGSKGLTLAFLILSFLLPFAAEGKKVKYSDGTVIYQLDTSTRKATVTGVEDGSSSRKVNILDYILNMDDGKTYTVTAIAKEAFLGSFLENITLPATIETIGTRAFETCSFKKLELPANLKIVGAYAFCNAFKSKTAIDLVIPSGCTTIRGFAFNGCSIRSIRFNSKLTILGEYSFANTDLTEVDIPATLTTLGDGAFAYCLKMTTATVRGNRTTLPYQFFDGCSALTSVSIPSTITKIDIWAFANCTSLRSIALPSSLKTIGDLAFYKSGLTSISLPNGLQTLGDHAFADIPTLTEVTIPATVTKIADYCFSGCEGIMTVTSPRATPCELGTYGFDGKTYTNAKLNIPAGSETAYKSHREWSCFHCLYDFETGIDSVAASAPESPRRRVVLSDGRMLIEVSDGDRTLRFDLHGRPLD